MLLILLQTKYSISSQVGLVYLSVVIDLGFTVSLMLLWQLNQVLKRASPAGETQPEYQGMPLPPAPASAVLPGLDRAACSRLCVQHILWGSSRDLPGTPSPWEEICRQTAEKEHSLFQMCPLAHVPRDSFTDNVCRPCLCNTMQKSLNLFGFCCALENMYPCSIWFSQLWPECLEILLYCFLWNVVLFNWRILYVSLKSILFQHILVF